MWDKLINTLNAIKARLEIADRIDSKSLKELEVIIKYAKSTKADSRTLAFLAVCLYVRVKTEDLEVNAKFFDLIYELGNEALNIGTYDNLLRDIHKDIMD